MERKPCLRCSRAIDASARMCPFCNWDQTEAYTAPIAEHEAAIAAPAAVPSREKSEWRKRLLVMIGGPLLLIASFALGLFLYRMRSAPPNGPSTHDATPQTTSSAGAPAQAPRAGTAALVAAGEGAQAEQPITTAPTATNPANPADIQRTDITAASSLEYSALAARAKTERTSPNRIVDPRSITGPAYAAAPAVAPPRRSLAAAQQQSAPEARPQVPAQVARTRPVPEFQPIPSITVDRTTTATLDLMIGADGRVKDVNVRGGIPGQTPRLIAAVQSWRFRPATENGVPVAAPFSVDISFHGRD